MKTVIMSVVLAIAVVILVIRLWSRRPAAKRKAFIAMRETVRDLAFQVHSHGRNWGVRPSTRQKATETTARVARFNRVAANDRVDWPELLTELTSYETELTRLIVQMRAEIKLSEMAQVEAPKLLQRLPAKLQVAATELAKYPPIFEANKKLVMAQQEFAKAQAMVEATNLTIHDWVAIYEILVSCQSCCAAVEMLHRQRNKSERAVGAVAAAS